jgi:hypothetical protein
MRPSQTRAGALARWGRLALWALPGLLAIPLVGWLGLGAADGWASDKPSQKKSATRPVKAPAVQPVYLGPMVVLGFNDLGMHCMNDRFNEICILPPYNNLHAQVIARGEEPRIVTSGVTVSYNVPGNTRSSTKTDFWQYAHALFGATLKPDVGLTGNGLSGNMNTTGNGDWAATGIPITPIQDDGSTNAYALSNISVTARNTLQARTVAVVPVSWEIRCDLCHNTPGVTVASDILIRHDRLHGTDLQHHKPVLCASCHADPALGTLGVPGVKSMSSAMHGSHASRMALLSGNPNAPANACYACHPGKVTDCQRDVHKAKGITCGDCHSPGWNTPPRRQDWQFAMATVGNPNRTAWVDEPTCGSCHSKRNPSFDYEEPGKLFKVSRGHHGVLCASCHGSPHAVVPAVTAPDNQQSIALQGKAAPLGKCSVCHRTTPDDRFTHSLRGDD